MLSVLVKQGTTLHLSPEGGGGGGKGRGGIWGGGGDHPFGGGGGGGGGGKGIGGILRGWGSHTFRGGRGELLLQVALREDHVNYGPITRVIGSCYNFFFVAEKQQRN